MNHFDTSEVRAHGPETGFPWSHIIGFVVSIVLTLLAWWFVQASALRGGGLIAVILILAALQIVVQLFFFMHVTESHGPRYHAVALTIAAFFIFCIVAGSIWIMTFGGLNPY